MEIRKEKNGNALILHLSGKLAIKESQALDQVVRSELSGITDLTLDMTEVPYISSAGLRVLIIAQNMMDEVGGTLTITHVSEMVGSVLELTGFSDFMKIE
ncbi:anti-sigma B factor antagonist [Succiniclasticum ruminis]|jgi:anti-sigma B factor antagonist|uniref:Anti-sigma factor antagonist n=1 Tax=Succiniclasticum ruminis TaxID=40841 RepID=A0A1G6K946_9FIRM|nr:STAS domain-containing protein [Succiniclasticum ruminis]SDC27540.1 anti-sigma B factor antagonist [Succiniclasticum ruminis]